jgi:UMF1 family MFS transporter
MGKTESKFKIFIWSLFDFANSSYSIVVVTFIYAVYFKDVVAGGKPIGDLFWSIGISISMLISGIIAPVLGAIADYSAGKKRFLLFFTLLSIISTALLYFVQEGMLFWGLFLFILANIGFEAGLVFYDSFLPEITKPKNYGRVSGYGFALGYLGSLASLALVIPFIKADMINETFPVSAFFFFVFATPLFFFLKDSRRNVPVNRSFVAIGFKRVRNTIRNLQNYKNLALFLLAFFFYIEGVNTTIFFAGNFARTSLHFSFTELALFFLIVQTTAILGSILFGILSDSIGQKKSIIISLYIWIITMFLAFIISNEHSPFLQKISFTFNLDVLHFQARSFYVVGLLAGSVMGATQSVSRSLMTKLTPTEKKTEFFGFYSLFGKSSAIIGPLVFGIISYVTGSQSYAILSISLFFIVGLIALRFVKD